MSVQDVKSLLQKYQFSPNKLLGQNFMVDSSVYPKLTDYAGLDSNDVVLDAGAGFGFLTRYLAGKCKQVIAVEKDPAVAEALTDQLGGIYNITIIEGDVLKAEVPPFNKAISIPPYYLSSSLVLWLLDRGVDCAVLIVQKEFADRLAAKVGSEDYSWLTVVAYQGTEVELFEIVPKWMFYPEPQIDSVIVRLKPWKSTPFKVNNPAVFRRMAKWLFTQRNKKLGNALEPFIRTQFKISKEKAEEIAMALPQAGKRVRELYPSDFGAIADAITK